MMLVQPQEKRTKEPRGPPLRSIFDLDCGALFRLECDCTQDLARRAIGMLSLLQTVTPVAFFHFRVHSLKVH